VRHCRNLWLGGLILVVTHVTAHAAETVSYSYDALGRLRTATHSGSVNDGVGATFEYDAAGNLKVHAVSATGRAFKSATLQGTAGQPVTVNANIPGAAAGTVSFFSAGRKLGEATVADGRAALVATFAEPGTYIVMIHYQKAAGQPPLVLAAPVHVHPAK